MKHKPSIEDREYLNSFRKYKIDASTFHHREHLQVAYTLLSEKNIEEAHVELKSSILGLLNHLGIGTDKYHETMTYAWLLAVKHFMETSDPSHSFNAFLNSNKILLDKNIMFTHYSEELIFSKRSKRVIYSTQP